MIARMSLQSLAIFRGSARYALPLAILFIVILFAIAEPAFLKPENLVGIIRQMTLVGIMAVAMTFVIMTGGVDLSVGPVLALSGLTAFFAMDAGLGLPIAIAAALIVGILIGMLNGTLVSMLGLPPIIVTLAMLSMVRGLALIWGGPELHLIRNQDAYTFIGTGYIGGISFSVILFVVFAAVVMFVQKRTPLGLLVAGIGENERAAYLSGHRVRPIKIAIYGLSGFGAALAGIIQTSQVHTSAATYGEFGTELDVIAAVVLGGTSLMGGNGSIARTLTGVLFLGVINNGMNILNVPLDIQLIAKGIVIILSMALSELS
jgi:ribose/xylose/arabinose/galactoside ABC-type transport system permease subunit